MSDDKVPRITDVVEHGVRKYGMKVGDYTACLVREIGIKATRKLKAEAARRGGMPETILHREANYLSEYAINRYLTNKKHYWRGLGSMGHPDFKLWCGKKVFTIDIHSGHHRSLMDFKTNPVIFYPAWRVSDPEKHLDDYLIGASVYSYKNGSSGVAYWGAIEQERLITIILRLWRGKKPIPTSGNEYVGIPLGEFNPQLMMDLLAKVDTGRQRYKP